MRFRNKIIAGLLILMTSACGGSNNNSGSAGSISAGSDNAFILTTDFVTGAYSTIDTTSRSATNSLGTTHGDAAAFDYEGKVYILNRLGADNLQVVDPANGFATTAQYSVGSGTNPFGIAFESSTLAYVTRYADASLLIINPSTGENLFTLDMTAFADADGIPEMAAVTIKNGKLYVAVQRLDRNNFFTPAGGSLVAVYDIATRNLVTTITLPFQNPVGAEFETLSGDRIAISCVGSYGVNDGGIAVIDTTTDTVSALGTTEAELGGDLGAIALNEDGSGFAIVSDTSFNTILKSFTTGGTVTTLYSPTGFVLSDVTIHSGELWVSDRDTTTPGVRIFDSATGAQITTEPISTGLAPTTILFP
jgi:hypothetical protein